ncbi:MAG: 6-phosphogluconolactonase [Nitrospirota bacterium]
MIRPSDRLVLSGPEDVAREAAVQITKIAEEVLGTGREFRLVPSGGSTPKRLYDIPARDGVRSDGFWNRVHFFWGDERCVGPDDPDSNYRTARETLLAPLGIIETHVHRMRGESSDPDAAAREYEADIRRHFNWGTRTVPPSFDLVLLGMGSDGHTASLFPETPALMETVRWVVANPVFKLGAHRLTLTIPIINRASWVIVLAAGAEKAQTLAQVLEGPWDPERLPAQSIRPTTGKMLWLVDRDAAAGLRPVRGG